MANIKSQIKRNKQNESRRVRNRVVRGTARTAVSKARSAFEANSPETKEAVMEAISALDKAAEMGVLHPNNAARRKSRLMRRLASMSIQPVPPEAPAEETKARKASSRKTVKKSE